MADVLVLEYRGHGQASHLEGSIKQWARIRSIFFEEKVLEMTWGQDRPPMTTGLLIQKVAFQSLILNYGLGNSCDFDFGDTAMLEQYTPKLGMNSTGGS